MPQKEEAKGYFRLVFKHTVLSLACVFILLAIAALLVTGGLVPMERLLVFVLLAEAAGVFFGGWQISRRAANHKLPMAVLMGGCVFFVLLVAGLLFSFPPARHGFWILLASVIPAIAGGVLGSKPKRIPDRRF